MHFKYQVIVLFIGLAVGMAGKYITGPSIQTFGTDYTPSAPVASSLRISGKFTNENDFSLIDREMDRFMRQWDLTGASVAIAKDGEMVFAKGYGLADAENEVPVEPYHLFRVASISKLITTTGIMKLVEEGKLSLNDKVFGDTGILNAAPYNNYRDRKVENIEVLHLLNHSGGWTNRWGDPMFMPTIIARKIGKELPISDEDIITFMLDKRLHYAPGTMSSYSNLGYAILSKVIERVSGQAYEDYIQTNILYPLGIFDMQLGGSYLEDRKELEVKYYEPANSILINDHAGREELVPRSYGGNDIRTLGAAGGWIASATDLMRLMLTIDGEPYPADILSPESVQMMTTPIGNGFHPLGWRGVRLGERYRTGTLAGSSVLMVNRQDGISYVILFNSSTWKGPMLANDIRSMMHQCITRTTEWPAYDLFELAALED
jgi:CubicO group peptidase (beta-lactamase class C family)